MGSSVPTADLWRTQEWNHRGAPMERSPTAIHRAHRYLLILPLLLLSGNMSQTQEDKLLGEEKKSHLRSKPELSPDSFFFHFFIISIIFYKIIINFLPSSPNRPEQEPFSVSVIFLPFLSQVKLFLSTLQIRRRQPRACLKPDDSLVVEVRLRERLVRSDPYHWHFFNPCWPQ